ncbi:MAG TPA: Rossmann-like and DUF2520 domain-containing protein [Blastocatellia bacterium]|nr:Rossmann-like and DUF2520 domain-containing protein [Blastocatellia bacterium]
MKQPVRLSIIGAGRVGQTLARLGQAAGYHITDVVCRSRRKASSAVRFIGAGTPQVASGARLQAANLIFIATPDDRVDEAARLIADNARAVGRTVVLHTSGALSSAALNGLRASHIAVGSCHPLQSFESPRQALGVIRQSYFCVEGDGRAVRAARAFVRRIGARAFEISSAMKPLYHAAAVMASGGLTALLSASLEALQHCGLSEAEARRVLLPLSEATLANVRTVGPRRALTGPVRRGDVGTVRQNLNALAALDAQWQAIYRLLAAQSLRLVEPQADRATVEALRSLLTSDC